MGPRCPATLDPMDPLIGITIVPYTKESGLELLGSPVHHPQCWAFTVAFCESKLASFQKLANKVSLLPDPQLKHALTRHCLDACRLLHLQKTVPWSAFPALGQLADTTVRRLVQECVGAPLSPAAWDQACLPVSAGRERPGREIFY